MNEKRYILADGTQVRDEDFGLLFYTMDGPRLYFLSSGDLLEDAFFSGERNLQEWLKDRFPGRPPSRERILSLQRGLDQLKEKGVILEH